MASVVSREAYFDTGLGVLSDRGYGGLKLAEVCKRLGATTGSFDHYFPDRPSYTKELVAHWMHTRTVRVIEALRAEPDLRCRIDALLTSGLKLPFGAEAALRLWISGYEQADVPLDVPGLRWIAGQPEYALDSGRCSSVPDGE